MSGLVELKYDYHDDEHRGIGKEIDVDGGGKTLARRRPFFSLLSRGSPRRLHHSHPDADFICSP